MVGFKMNDESEMICLMKVTSQRLCGEAVKYNEKYLPKLLMSQPRL